MENQLQLVLVILCGFLSALGSSQTISKMAVRSDIRFRFATTEMTCVMTNEQETASELTFDVTLPKDAFIANFSMEIEGKSYPGDVKKKQEARQEYLAARRSGSFGGLVEQSARHSNKFDVSVNIAAQSNVTFTLIYQEVLRRRFGSYEYSVYIDNQTLTKIEEYSMEIYIQDRNKIQDVRTPAMRKEVMNNDVEESPNTLTQISNPSETTVYVLYRPTPKDLKEQGSGWFVVQYDVDSDSAGDLLVVDGYFVHFFMPPDDLPPMPLDIVFVLDISGSMAGHKLNQLKGAMRIILNDLRETDRFNILLFDSSVQQWETSLQEASKSNVGRAQDYVGLIKYRGSTNLHLALMKGLQLLQGSREASRVPMIFFLTDGEATVGEQDSAKIMADVSQKNEGVVNIYSLAFGAGADYKLLRQISAKNNGFARKIYEASDAAQQVSGLYREISTIVMRGLTVSYHPTSNNDDGHDDNRPPLIIDNSTITICDLSILYGRSDFVVAGKLENAEILESEPEKAGGLKLEVSGLGAKQQINFVLEESDLSQLTLEGENPFWSVPRDLSKMAERTWAFLMIKQLLKEKMAALENPDLVKDLDARIVELSLKYHFVTPVTSMVVTRPEDGLKKNMSEAASFTADEDVPAAKMVQQHRPAYSSHRRYPQVLNSMSPLIGSVNQQQVSSLKMDQQHRPADSSYRRYPQVMNSMSPLIGSVNQQRVSSHMLDMDHFMFLLPQAPDSVNLVRNSPPMTRPTLSTRADHGKRPNNKKAGKGRRRKNKKCISNKRVFLQSVLVHGSKTPVSCYEVKASRSETHSYILFQDPSGNITVVAGIRRRFLLDLYILRGNERIQVSVTPKGELASSVPLPVHDQAIQVTQGSLVIRVNVTKKTCKGSFVSIDIDVGVGDADPAVVKKYTGIVAKAIQKAARSKRRRGKGKRKKVPKGCRASKVPADRSIIAKGKYLMRYKV